MTCFWDTLRSRLNINNSNTEFISYLKGKNTKDITVLWNDIKFTEKQLDENYEHIKDFDKNNINNGYDCSICDPFLILICELCNVNIEHNYNSYRMKYFKPNNNKTIDVRSDLGHFS